MRGNVERRGPDTWRIRIYLGRHPDTGQQRYLRRTIHGTRTDADQHLARLLVEHGAGHHRDDDTHTVDDVVTRWLTMVRNDLSPATVKDYTYVLDTHIRPTFGQRPIQKLKPHDLEYWYHTLTIGPARIRRIHNVLSSALDQAVRWQWLVTNPCDYARPPKVTEREVRPPTPAEVRRLVDHADDPDLATYVHVAAHTGARRGELAALRWTDIDLDAATVTIARSVVAVDGQVVVKRTKTGKARVVSLDPETVTVLRAQRTRQRAAALALGVTATDGPVFASDPEAQRGWYPDSISRRFNRLCQRADVTGIRLHDLRHFAATQMIAAGIDPRTVAGRLGHSPTTLLGRYSHFLPAADRAAAAELGRIMARD